MKLDLSRTSDPGMPPDAAPISPSERLCLSCGICCQGVIFGKILIEEDESPLLLEYGLPVLRSEAQTFAPQPCSFLDDTRCTVYERRFRSCHAYRCDLLRDFQRGRLSIEAGLAIVKRTRTQLAQIRAEWTDLDPGKSMWTQVENLNDSLQASTNPDERKRLGQLAIRLRLFSGTINQHFDARFQRETTNSSHRTSGKVA